MLWHASLRGFLGEVGDKTFFLTMVLTAWCPWEGVRDDEERSLQLGLVYAGSLLALVTRVTVNAALEDGINMTDCAFEAASCLMLLVLGLKAKMELARADAKDAKSRPAKAADAAANPFGDDVETTKAREPQWNKDAFAGAPSAPVSAEAEDPAYGTLRAPVMSVDGVFSQRISDKLVSHVLAFFAPLLMNICLEAEDKSLTAFTDPWQWGTTAPAFGAMIGFIPAIFLAVFLGYIAERQFSEQRLLFLISTILLGLSLISLSQALMHMSAANVAKPMSASQVFLSITSFISKRAA